MTDAPLTIWVHAKRELSQLQKPADDWADPTHAVKYHHASVLAARDAQIAALRGVLEIVADGHSDDYTDNCIRARAVLAALDARQDGEG